MSEIEHTSIIDNLRGIDKNGTLLDILLEFEHMLDEQGMYAYKNWKMGEVAQGPKLTRYWLNVTLLYPHLKMPDPKAALRLTNIGCEVNFKKSVLKVPVTPKSQEDLDKDNKPKVKSHKIWLVDVWMPRKFVDEALQNKVQIDGEIDATELSSAYETGLDDETNIGQD
jgi:hypothetical protein|tara:strand:+ start:731 stop:1234 length:504 start_codon:yes stop_codon:yes gene_type:complete